MENKIIKNIIFDLGGVIIDLDTPLTIKGFAQLTNKSEEEILEIAKSPIFKKYEKGEIESNKFREGLRELFSIEIKDSDIDVAWNAMIGDTPFHRLQWLSSLSRNYRVFILSNTNHIHVNYFHNYLSVNHGVKDFSEHVEKVYYSQLIGMRKPDKEIFDFVIKENNLNPNETLFLDDNIDNIEGAIKSGIVAINVKHPENVPQLLANAGVEI